MADKSKQRPIPEIRQEDLAKSIVAQPLLDQARKWKRTRFPVIIELNLDFTGGRAKAREDVRLRLRRLRAKEDAFGEAGHPFLFAEMSGVRVLQLARDIMAIRDWKARPLYRIWLDYEVTGLLIESVRTVKADAARVSFAAEGQGIVWAVIDSGVDGLHPHFDAYDNLELKAPLQHFAFTTGTDPELGCCDGDTPEKKRANRKKLVGKGAWHTCGGHHCWSYRTVGGESRQSQKAAGFSVPRIARLGYDHR